MMRSNNRVTAWEIQKAGDNIFSGFQQAEGKMFFYAVSNYDIENIVQEKDDKHEVSIVNFRESKGKNPLELKIGFSFVSIENAKANLEKEMLNKDFAQVCGEANDAWTNLLSKIQVTGGTEREK